ncbi:MAG: RIP metalloprotease RseP [Proteobacteria bacterium]|nr:RIP metalloprotease RseP [Pseudomonadota bacterium]
MSLIHIILHNLFSFIVIISLIVFIHEFGHFIVARWCGVKIDEFAIGFGKALFSFRDKKNTEWKFCLWPFGGYVKMYGDRNGASIPDIELIKQMSAEERKISFLGKNVYQRIAIVSAGPIANFILAILILTFLFRLNGEVIVEPVVSEIVKDSASFEAGLKKGDRIITIDNKPIKDFQDIRNIVVTGLETSLNFKIQRDDQLLDFAVNPKTIVQKDMFGDEVKIRSVGIMADEITQNQLNFGQSFVKANIETYNISISILKTLGQLISGKRSIKELGGPVKIAKYSGKTVEQGLLVVAWFMAMISINLGVMNLLPIPVLDGGHLFYYLIEAIKGKPLSQKIQSFGYSFGFALVISLMIFTTLNDIIQMMF